MKPQRCDYNLLNEQQRSHSGNLSQSDPSSSLRNNDNILSSSVDISNNFNSFGLPEASTDVDLRRPRVIGNTINLNIVERNANIESNQSSSYAELFRRSTLCSSANLLSFHVTSVSNDDEFSFSSRTVTPSSEATTGYFSCARQTYKQVFGQFAASDDRSESQSSTELQHRRPMHIENSLSLARSGRNHVTGIGRHIPIVGLVSTDYEISVNNCVTTTDIAENSNTNADSNLEAFRPMWCSLPQVDFVVVSRGNNCVSTNFGNSATDGIGGQLHLQTSENTVENNYIYNRVRRTFDDIRNRTNIFIRRIRSIIPERLDHFVINRELGTRNNIGNSTDSNAIGATNGNESNNDINSNRRNNNIEDDNPICQQLLCIVGCLCWLPLLWIIGSMLLVLTPKEHTRSRKWGLVNCLLGLFSLLHLALDIWLLTVPLVDHAIFLSKDQHVYEEPGRIPTKSGSLYVSNGKSLSQRNIVEWNFSDDVSFTGWNYMSENMTWKYGRIQYKAETTDGEIISGWVLGPVSGTGSSSYNVSVIVSPPIIVSGRIQFLTYFSWGTVPSDTAIDIINRSVRKEPALYDSTFPRDTSFSEMFSINKTLPMNFVGSGIVCKEISTNTYREDAKLSDIIAYNSKWIFQYRRRDGLDEPAQPASSVLVFSNKCVCSVALVNTFGLANDHTFDTYIDIEYLPRGFLALKKLVLKSLP